MTQPTQEAPPYTREAEPREMTEITDGIIILLFNILLPEVWVLVQDVPGGMVSVVTFCLVCRMRDVSWWFGCAPKEKWHAVECV